MEIDPKPFRAPGTEPMPRSKHDWRKDRNKDCREGSNWLAKIILDHGIMWFRQHIMADGPPTVTDTDLRSALAGCRNLMCAIRSEMRARDMTIHPDEEFVARCLSCKKVLATDSDYANGMCGKCDP